MNYFPAKFFGYSTVSSKMGERGGGGEGGKTDSLRSHPHFRYCCLRTRQSKIYQVLARIFNKFGKVSSIRRTFSVYSHSLSLKSGKEFTNGNSFANRTNFVESDCTLCLKVDTHQKGLSKVAAQKRDSVQESFRIFHPVRC
jgi:hypothetical protein